jgi:hypothetical protein
MDGDPSTAWIAPWDHAAAPWIRVSSRSPFDLRRLRIEPARRARVARPTRVELSWPGGRAEAEVLDGRIDLPRPVRTRTLTLRVLAASPAGAAAVGIAEMRAPGLTPIRVPRTGRIRGCGAGVVLGGATVVRLRVDGDIRDLDAGRPLRARGCSKLALGRGPRRVRIPAATLRPDSVLLTSPAPSPIARTTATPGSVLDPGDPGRGRRDNVKLDVRGPAWLVLGESFDRGWRAWCGDRALGEPVPLDGYANAWPIDAGCKDARFAFAPQRPVHAIQLLSALACLILLAIALGVRIRGRGGGDRRAAADWPDSPPRRMAASRAAVAGIVAGGILAFCFSLRSGVLIAPAVAFALWRGIPAAPLAVAGGLLLALAVPLDYILFPAPDFGGYNPGYAGDQVSGHWIAVAGWVLLALALWRTLSTASGRRGGPSTARADAGE